MTTEHPPFDATTVLAMRVRRSYHGALLGGEDRAVRVAVMGDPQVRAHIPGEPEHVPEVLLGGLAGVPGELPLGIGVEGDGPDAQLLQEQGRGLIGGPVGAVQHRRQPSGLYGGHIHMGQDGVDVRLAQKACQGMLNIADHGRTLLSVCRAEYCTEYTKIARAASGGAGRNFLAGLTPA